MIQVPEILKLFKEQLTNEIAGIVHTHGFKNEGYGFAHWYFKHVRKMTDIEASEQICDGSSDLGIDAIEIHEEEVIFYQFKNPKASDKTVAAGDIDKMISGLELVLSQAHEKIANAELLSRLEEIYSFTPTGYRICIVCSSMGGLPDEAEVKLKNFCHKHSGAAKNLFRWDFYNLNDIHNSFYSANLPTLDATLDIPLSKTPYMTRIGEHETYLFDLSGSFLAQLYEDHGEGILQQNVRMFEGDRGTNLAIAQTASSPNEAKDFFHYNNGISIICDNAVHKPFNNELALERPQIVNGGQTVRILHKCMVDGNLQDDVHASVRVITTSRNKEFASNVAVNLNNQTRVDSTFLRSNDPRIVQLYHSLSTQGYFLERRAGELDAMLPDEIGELEKRYGSPLADRVIPLKDGMQAYVASFYGDPQLAKKDPAKIFTDEGGSFSKVLQSGLTADNFRIAYSLSRLVAHQVDSFKKIKRKHYSDADDRKNAYAKSFGSAVTAHFPEIDAAVPQITVFALALLYEKYVKTLKYEPGKVNDTLALRSDLIWDSFSDIMSAKQSLDLEKSWPTLLKSGVFFRDVVAELTSTWQDIDVPEMQ